MAKLTMLLLLLVSFAAFFIPLSSPYSFPPSEQTILRPNQQIAMANPLPDDPISPGVPLHIMPIGDSITEGFRSTDHTGYRLHLLNLLTHAHDNVTYLGSLHSGRMRNDAHEGYGGHTIRQIAAVVGPSLRARHPNVVLLHAGTNDMNMRPPEEPDVGAPERLGELIDAILHAHPNATVVVAQIVQSSIDGTRERVAAFNAAVPAMVAARRRRHHHRPDRECKVLVADMRAVGAGGADLADGLHPDDAGYATMAAVWLRALREAGARGWIAAPDGAA